MEYMEERLPIMIVLIMGLMNVIYGGITIIWRHWFACLKSGGRIGEAYGK